MLGENELNDRDKMNNFRQLIFNIKKRDLKLLLKIATQLEHQEVHVPRIAEAWLGKF